MRQTIFALCAILMLATSCSQKQQPTIQYRCEADYSISENNFGSPYNNIEIHIMDAGYQPGDIIKVNKTGYRYYYRIKVLSAIDQPQVLPMVKKTNWALHVAYFAGGLILGWVIGLFMVRWAYKRR